MNVESNQHLADARMALDFVNAAQDLLDRARDILGGSPLMENKTWAILADSYRETSRLMDQLELLVLVSHGLAELEVNA